MLNEREQKQLIEIMFPKKNQEISFAEWEEFHQIVNFEKLSEEERKEMFLKYAEDSFSFVRAREIVNVMLDADPTLASQVPMKENKTWLQCMRDESRFNWDAIIDAELFDFTRKHADSCFNFVSKTVQDATETDVGTLLSALDNENFCKMFDEACERYIENGRRDEFPTNIAHMVSSLEFNSLNHPKNHARVAEILLKTADKTPHALMAKGYHLQGHQNAQTLLQFAFDKELKFKSKANVAKMKALRDQLPAEARASFDEMIFSYEPVAAAIIQIQEKHPEILEVEDDKGVSLAQQIGIGTKNKQNTK